MRAIPVSIFASAALVVAAIGLPHAQTPAARASSKLTIDQLVEIKHPSAHQWTPDGSHVWWVYDDGGVNNVWAAPASGAGRPVQLTNYPDGQTGAGGFWSHDSQTFFYQRDGGLLAVPVTGGAPHPAWPGADHASGFAPSPDGTRIAYILGQGGGGARGGRGAGGGRGGARGAAAPDAAAETSSAGADLMVHTIAPAAEQKIAHVDGRIGGVSWSPDGTKLAFSTAGATSALMVAALPGGAVTTVVSSAGPIGAPAWTPDGANLTYAGGGGAGGAGAGPGYIDNTFPEIGAKLVFRTNTGGGGRGGGGGENFIVPATGGTPKPMAAGRAGGGGGRGGGGGNWLDATHVMSTATSNGGKTRTTEAVDINGGAPKTLHEETEEKFFSAVNNTANAISPDHKWLLFTADTTGWDEIYIVPTAGGTPTLVTKNPGDHWRAVWSHDSKHIAWDTDTQDKPGDRQVEFATIGDNGTLTMITGVTSGNGTNTSPQWSPDDKRLLFQHTDAENSADLYVADAAAGAKVTRLTSSMPASIDHSIFVPPTLIHYPGPDGKQVPAWLFVPKNLDRTTQHPAIVWIHPDGVNQNYDGFHTDRNEGVYYEFHQYLLQQGYVVIAPDYRGSIGYGRDWRNDVYMDVGGNDAKDARMARNYLNTLGYVDSNRIGVWGLSYGGFFTLLAITQEPTWFHCAVDVAGVADYHLYYEDPYHGGWTTSRIGTPEEHPDVYAKADPMSHVDQIQHPLLVLAGTADVNVPFVESALLIDHLLKAGKGPLTTFMMYPGEFHYFDRSFVVRDAWHRVDDFFKEHLQPEKATAKK